jgi:hypothetical protein
MRKNRRKNQSKICRFFNGRRDGCEATWEEVCCQGDIEACECPEEAEQYAKDKAMDALIERELHEECGK